MRNKDAIEMANVLGRSMHFADEGEREGIMAAWGEISEHLRDRFPNVDLPAANEAFRGARQGRFFP